VVVADAPDEVAAELGELTTNVAPLAALVAVLVTGKIDELLDESIAKVMGLSPLETDAIG
jgi:hypothetical protein